MLQSPTVDPVRQHCSQVTLQSEEKGHFANFANMVASANPDMISQFQKLDTDEERVMFCTMLNKVDHFTVQPIFKKKCADTARAKRTEGNEAYSKKRYKQAKILYTISAVKAPNTAGDDSMSYAIANRSACLYYLGDMSHAIQDIELALNLGYPDQLRYKLWERKAKSFVHLGQYDKAKLSLISAKKNLEANKDKFEEKKFKQATKSLKELLAVVVERSSIKDEVIQVEEGQIPDQPKLTKGCHKKLRNISSLLKVEHNDEVGRHVMAVKPVKAGDTLVVEEPIGAVLYSDKMGSNCDACFAKLHAAVPCPHCAGIAFCSPACRDSALAGYHQYECQFLDLMEGLGGSALARLAYRLVGSKSLKFFNNIKHQLNVDERGFDQVAASPSYSIPGVKKTDYGSYLATFNLVGLDSERWPEDLFNRALMATCLLKILKATRYFPDKSDENTFTHDEIFIGSLMMRHLNVLQFNAHEIYEFFRGDRGRMKPCKNSLLGVGVYPQASYFNHSCHPATARYNIGQKMVVKALVPVDQGQEVCENYGQVFYFKPREERRKELSSRYWFDCECPACREDWPLLKENTQVRWRGGKAKESALEDLKTVFDCGVDFMEHGQAKEAVDSLTEYINEVYGMVEPPLETVVRAEDKLRTCCNNMGTVIFQDNTPVLRTNPAERSSNLMTK